MKDSLYTTLKHELLLVMLMLFTLPTALFAQNYKDGDTFTAKTIEGVDMFFRVISASEKTAEVYAHNGFFSPSISKTTVGAVTIPSVTNGFNVVKINSVAFYGCDKITSVYIPESVTTMANSIFYGCAGLKEVNIPTGITRIELETFYGCSELTSLSLPSGVNYIEKGAFMNCIKLKQINLPEGISILSEDVFRGCSSLENVVIPESVETIGFMSFYECASLNNVIIPRKVSTIGKGAFYGCNKLEEIFIHKGITSIGGSDDSNFYNAFGNCPSLSKIVVENGNPIFDSRNGCNAIIISATNSIITGCKTTIIPQGIQRIEGGSFEGCTELVSLDIPDGVQTIGSQSFQDCKKLKEVNFPKSLITIEARAFASCESLESVLLPEGLTEISWQVFCNCYKLNSINIPPKVVAIREGAFMDCSLTSVTIPQSVKSIESNAFYECIQLTEINSFIEEPFSIAESTFIAWNESTSSIDHVIYNNAILHVPQGCMSKYKSCASWNLFKNIVEDLRATDPNYLECVDDLQAKLDAIAARGTSTVENPEAIDLSADIVINKQLFVRNGCHAVLTGAGRLRFTEEVAEESLILITGESSLKLENCNFETNSVLSSTTKQVFKVDWKSSLHFVRTFFFNYVTGLSNKSIVYLNGGDVTFDYLYGTTEDLTVVKGYGHVLINDAKMVVSKVPVIDGIDMIITMNNGSMDSGGECVVRSLGNSFTMNGGSVNGSNPSTVVIDAASTNYNGGYVGGNTTICNWGQIADGNMRFGVERIIFKSNNLVGGTVKLPILELDKDRFEYILVESALQNEWQIDAQWSEFPLGKKLIFASEYREYKKLTKEDYEKMTFLNMPGNREAYYDETDCSVKLRERTVDTSDDLQDFINGLGDNKGTEGDPVIVPVGDDGLAIDGNVDVNDDLQLFIDGGSDGDTFLPIRYAGGFICIFTNCSFAFNHVAMVGTPSMPSGSSGGIKNSGKLKLTNSTVTDGVIVNSGGLYIDGNVSIGGMQHKHGGRMYVTSSLSNDVNISIADVADLELYTPIILGGDGYLLSFSDTDHVHLSLPEGYEWKYDIASRSIVIIVASGISQIPNEQPTVVGTYDATGRSIDAKSKGLHIQRMSDGTVRKHF